MSGLLRQVCCITTALACRDLYLSGSFPPLIIPAPGDRRLERLGPGDKYRCLEPESRPASLARIRRQLTQSCVNPEPLILPWSMDQVMKCTLCLVPLLLTCVGLDVAVVADVLLQGEPGKVEVVGDLHRVVLLPLVLQVVRCPAVCNIGSQLINPPS